MNRRSLLTLIGVMLIIFGLATFAYRGFVYKTEQNVTALGPFQLTQEKNKIFYFNPWMSTVSVIAGLVLVLAGRENRPKS